MVVNSEKIRLLPSYMSTCCSRKSSNVLQLLPKWFEKLHIVILFKNINELLNLQKDGQRETGGQKNSDCLCLRLFEVNLIGGGECISFQ